jgi:uncharacterized membrane protein HdeD (DUF308 family)
MNTQEESIKKAVENSDMETAAGDILPNLLQGARKTLIWRGIIFMIFGVLIITRPIPTIAVTVIIAGIYTVIEGVAIMIQALKLPRKVRGMIVINAVIMILLGTAAVIFPYLMGEYAVIFFGAWQLVNGVQCLYLMKTPGHRVRSFITGMFSIMAGLFFILMPLFGLLAMSWLLSALFITTDLMMLATGWSIKPEEAIEEIE